MSQAPSTFGILDKLDCAYFEVDFKGILINANDSFLNKSQLSLEELVGRHYRHMVNPSQVTDLYTAFSAVYHSGELRRVLFDFIQHKSGGYRTAEGIVGPIKNHAEEVVGFRGILFDVTERIKDETDLISAKQSAENELAIARKIQFSFLPADFSQVDGWNIDARFHSAREVAGDFYDVFPVSSGKRLGFVVADVCDKGIGAAMYMAIFRTLIRAFANINVATNLATQEDKAADLTESMIFRKQKVLAVGAQPLMNAIQMTNQYIARNHGDSNMFATVFFGVLNPLDGKLLYINAGHEPPIVVSEGKISNRLEPTGPAVGLMEDLQFNIGEVELKPGDLLFVYTDGVVDARDMKNQSFSEDRLISVINQNIDTPEIVVKDIMSALHEHISDQDQYDDLTLMSLYRNK